MYSYNLRTYNALTSSFKRNCLISPLSNLLLHRFSSCTPTMAPIPPRTPLKILMLHGYTQSGSLFHAKTRALEKHIQKHFPLHDVTFYHPNGPLTLDPADIPGYVPSSENTSTSNTNDSTAQEPEAFAWWRRADHADPPEYTGLDTGLSAVASILAEQGPFDGVIGFSQGAGCAAITASLLEPGRREAFEYFSNPANNSSTSNTPSSPSPSPSSSTTVTGIPFPAPFENLSHPPLKFVLSYSGFRAPGTRYRGFYERPKIQTPVLHVMGSLDAIVEEARSRALIDACEGNPESEGKVIWHPGGHFLPSQRPYLDGAVKFIKACLDRGEKGEENRGPKDEKVEDMDMPF